MKFPLTYDATTSREDFVRLLPAATGCAGYRPSGDEFIGEGWRIRLRPLPPLAIGMVRLERHRIEIEFDGLSEQAQDSFMRHFSIHYQRGGG